MGVHDPRVELQIGSSWSDVTGPVRMQDGIRHRRGRGSEGARVDASQTTLTLDDPTGRFNSRNPRSPYYGQIGRNTPLRYSVDGAAVALSIAPGDVGRAYAVNHASFAVTDLDVRAEATPVSWSGVRSGLAWEVCGRCGSGDASWWFTVNDTGTLTLTWSADGTTLLTATSSIPVPFGPGERAAIRATLDVNNGASGRTITFYTSGSISGTWAQLGDPIVQAGTTSVSPGFASLQVGDVANVTTQAVGRLIHAVQLRDGIGGTIVANPNFGAQSSGTLAFNDSAGRLWTVQAAAAITSRRTRVVGEVSEWAPRWHVSGNDVRAPLTAAGVMHRLNQGRKPLRSVLTRGIPSLAPDLVAYWPLEDGPESTQAYSPLPGVDPLTVTGLSMASDSSQPASAPLPTVKAGARMSGVVPPHTASDWAVHLFVHIPTAPSTSGAVLEWTTTGSPWKLWRLLFGPTNFELQADDGTGALTLAATGSVLPYDGTWWDFIVLVIPTGADLLVIAGGYSNLLTNTTAGRITTIDTKFGAAMDGTGIGHLMVFGSENPGDGAYVQAYRGEAAGSRVARLGLEESVPVDTWGPAAEQELMGYQRPGKLLDLMAEAEAVDGGILMEDRQRLGLIYRGRSTLYTQTPILTIPYADLVELGPPRDDDSRIRNDRTVNRLNGSFGQWVADEGPLTPDAVGLYDDEVTLNAAYDSQCQPIAQWLTHLGTVDEARYPRVRLYLHKDPQYIDAVTRLDVGSIVRVTDLPANLPPGPLDLLVEGYEEEVTTERWTLDLVCSPGSPWQVGELDDPDYGREDTDASQLAAPLTASATSLSVATMSGPLWSTDPADCPFNLDVNGETVRVTAVTGASSPQTMTATRAVNGVVAAHSPGDPVQLAIPSIAAL
ncbi:hypothetical protein [Streptomyces subrutilus]|uniref:hypothetical protein n=1 Tax=Streptomyces subrutilus TaxID=36818 RepID=UPI002E138C7B|nr:hypothetical protein OG479_33030 [Streptomyces subrutilus]